MIMGASRKTRRHTTGQKAKQNRPAYSYRGQNKLTNWKQMGHGDVDRGARR